MILFSALAAALAVFYPLVKPAGQSPEATKMSGTTSFRILLGLGDRAPQRWDGSVKLSGGRIAAIHGWRFAANDSTDGRSSWKASTRRTGAQGAAQKKEQQGAVAENGVIIEAVLDSAAARFDVETANGSFSFTAQETPFGVEKPALDGRALVERVPTVVRLTASEEEEDFPAVAQRGDDGWLSYVQFVHGDRQFEEGPRVFTEPPKSFDFLARPAGGDQVFLMHYSQARGAWDPPVPASAPHEDVMRTAVAVDGAGRVWVFWAANRGGNFDIYARPYAAGKWGNEARLTSDPGTDLNPVAATDSNGRVWVAWQGFRNGNLDILASVQVGDAFSAAQRISFSSQSDWDPAIAAGPDGEVAVSWDTYDKGDYDVYFRKLHAGSPVRMDAPTPVAASQNFEARSSVAYDGLGRLWVAYEASFTKWGKDFGAYETSGVALYQGHNIQVKCFRGGQAFVPAENVQDTLPGAVNARRARRLAAQNAPIDLPNADIAARRAPSAAAQAGPTTLNSFPRLTADREGRVYLAVRTPANGVRSPAGGVWTESVSVFDGAKWTGPIAIPNSDGLLDGRPALAASGSGQLLVISATDHRQMAQPAAARRRAGTAGDGVQTDLYAATFRVEGAAGSVKLNPVAAETVAAPQAEAPAELAQVKKMHDYRASVNGASLQLMRGEFHRHTEVSGDGLRDGPVIDAYRYLIDAAYMDWAVCCDHDNGNGREYSWWIEQKLTDAYKLGTRYVPMFGYERSVRYPEGHRNLVMARRGVRPLPRLPKVADDAPPAPAPDTQMLYRYLRQFGAIVASHTSGTDMGTDWRDNDPFLEPVVEIYQGDRQNYEMPDAPRSNSQGDSIGGWQPMGFVSLALQKGYRLGFQASSDHISTHMSYCNLWVTAPTREGIMEAFHKRRVYGATDNILADVRSGTHFMGEEFTVSEAPAISVKLRGTDRFAKVHIVRDGQYVYTTEPNTKDVDFVWKDNAPSRGKTSYYYVRGEQADGELVWVSPMWITFP